MDWRLALLFAACLWAGRARADFDGSVPGTESESELTDNAFGDDPAMNGENLGGDHEIDMAAEQAGQDFDHAMDQFDEEEELDVPPEEEESQPEVRPDEAGVERPSLIQGEMLYPYDPLDRDRKFYSISQALKKYEDQYIQCFSDLPDIDFLQSELDKCTGKDFVHVHNGLEYERRKVVAWADKSLHKVMVDHCYEHAGTDQTAADACDLFKADLFTLLWAQMPMRTLLEMHVEKYTRDKASMDRGVFVKLLDMVADVEEEYDALAAEVENHRESTVFKVKNYIKQRVEDIQDRFNRGEFGRYPRIKKDLITWTELLTETADYKLEMPPADRRLNPDAKRPRRATRNYQKAFIADWKYGKSNPKAVKEARKRPVGVDAGFASPEALSLLERQQESRDRRKVDRFQFFNQH